jgi:hypothetical protein
METAITARTHRRPLSSAGPHRPIEVAAPKERLTVVVVAVDGVVPDLALVDLLARLQLAARRAGGSVVLREPCERLRALLDLVGLAELLPLEKRREAEGGIQLGIQEVVQPGDAPP